MVVCSLVYVEQLPWAPPQNKTLFTRPTLNTQAVWYHKRCDRSLRGRPLLLDNRTLRRSMDAHHTYVHRGRDPPLVSRSQTLTRKTGVWLRETNPPCLCHTNHDQLYYLRFQLDLAVHRVTGGKQTPQAQKQPGKLDRKLCLWTEVILSYVMNCHSRSRAR